MDFLTALLAKFAMGKAAKMIIDEAENRNQPIDMPKNIEEYGFSQSLKNRGSALAYKMNIHHLYETFKQEVSKDTSKQEELRLPYRKRKEELETLIVQMKEKCERMVQVTKTEICNKIEALRQEIDDLISHPEKLVVNPANKMLYRILTILLILITGFLFVFYSSATYSAYMREFSAETIGVVHAIFNADTFGLAWEEGLTALFLIILAPAVFIGLGLVFHLLIMKRLFWALPLIMTLAFAFDALLGYEITKKIYDLEALQRFYDVPPYTLSLAFESMNFWLILFSGFVVYVLWGILFHFWIDFHREKHLLAEAIKRLERAIAEQHQRMEEIDSEVEEYQEAIYEYERELKQIEPHLQATLIDTKMFEQLIYGFTSGWIECIHVNRLNPELEEKVHRTLVSFMESHVGQRLLKSTDDE